MRRLTILLPILALACGQKSLDLQAAPHITPSTDPTVVGTIDEQVGPIAVDGERLYWMGSQGQLHLGEPIGREEVALRSCKKQDCAGSLVTYDSGEAEPSAGFGVQNGQIFWFHFSGDPSSIYSQVAWSILGCSVAGCASGARTVVAHYLLSPNGIGYASDAVYVNLNRIPLSGNTAPVVVATVPDGGIRALGLHGDYIYWAGGQPTLDVQPLALQRARTSGDAPPETLAEDVEIASYPELGKDPFPSTSGLAFDSSYVYWTQGTLGGAIDRCPLAGCSGAPEVVVAPIRWPLVILLDGPKIYWLHDSSSQGFEVSSCTIGDCATPDLIASDLDATNALAIDDQYLYTATSDHAVDPDLAWNNPVAQIRRFPK